MILKCPKCRDAPLRRPAGPGGGDPWTPAPVRCTRCAGLWFDGRVLSRIDADWPEPVVDGVAEGAAVVDDDPDKRAGFCPHGHGLLQRAPALPEDFYLDRCGTCSGVWLEAGEWRRLAEHRLLESLPEIWSEAWQRRQRRRRSEGAHLEWAETAFGDELFARLSSLARRLDEHPLRSEALAFLRARSRPAPPEPAAEGAESAEDRSSEPD